MLRYVTFNVVLVDVVVVWLTHFKRGKPTAATSYSLVTKQARTRGLLTPWVIPTLVLTYNNGSGSFVVVVLAP